VKDFVKILITFQKFLLLDEKKIDNHGNVQVNEKAQVQFTDFTASWILEEVS